MTSDHVSAPQPCPACNGVGYVQEDNDLFERLRAVLQATRDELNRWGHGDFHYGSQKQEQSVVDAVAMADRILKETLDA